jgi:hypothetical protein
MQIKIKEILETKNPRSPDSKKYTVYSWVINGQLKEDNGTVTNLSNETIKTLSSWVKDQIKPGSAWNVNIETYNGFTSFKILDKKPQEESIPGFKKFEKVSIDDFDMLVNHCWQLASEMTGNDNTEIYAKLFDKILGCASVMVDVKTLKNDLDEKANQSLENLNKAMGTESDDDIPF